MSEYKGYHGSDEWKNFTKNSGFDKQNLSNSQNWHCAHFWTSVLLPANVGVEFPNCSEAAFKSLI